MAEYLALYLPIVNKEFWRFQSNLNSPDSVLNWSPNGRLVTVGSPGSGTLFGGCKSISNLYLEQAYNFTGCDSLANAMIINQQSITGRPTGMATLVDHMYWAGHDFHAYGYPRDVCEYHETYCTGTNKQFVSKAECLRFMTALPPVSPACGNGGVFGGNSTTCRFKHHLMIPFNPSTHCFHIGYGDRPDTMGHFKCNDAIECPSPQQDGSALNLTMDAQTAACMAASNAVVDAPGYQTVYPLVCTSAPVPSGRMLRARD
jgi:hypothetical protein